MTHEFDRDAGSTKEGAVHDRDLDRRLAQLTREAAPPPAAWAGISKRIHRPRRVAVPLASAAAAVVAFAALLQLLPGDDSARTGPIQDPGRVLVQAEAEAMRRAAPVATGGLVDALPLAEAWAENQTAIDELEAALTRDPDNRMLLDFLAEARLRQVRLLNSGLVLTPRTEA